MDTPGGKRVYIDPWLQGNPACPESEWNPERVDIIAVTHPHFDHIGDVVPLAARFEPAIVAQYEVAEWLKQQGVAISEDRPGMNKGGTLVVDGIAFTMTHAVHSSGIVVGEDMRYGGDAAGYIITLENGLRLYVAGDTCVFGDMQILRELYEPDIAILPIGDYMTMGPEQAALALRLLGTKRCIPCHFGTTPLFTGTPDALRRLAPDVDVLNLTPGQPIEL